MSDQQPSPPRARSTPSGIHSLAVRHARRATTLGLGALAIWAASSVPAGVAAQGKSTLDGVYTDAQSERGAALAKDSCDVCHGAKFAGADMGPGLQPADFKAAWVGRSVSDLFEKIKDTMPANEPGTLTPAKSADLVAYILKLNDYPTGAADLPSDMAALKQIAIAEKNVARHLARTECPTDRR
jgi:mono/diheme cytochrome c family protein